MFKALSLMIALVAAPASANSICKPAAGAPLRVIGVAQNDPLNVRATAPSGRVVGQIRAGQPDVRATGRVVFLRNSCKLACAQFLGGAIGDVIAGVVERDCRASGRIWYEVTAGRNVRGWASAGYLLPVGGAVPPVATVPPRPMPVPPPANNPVYRFTCYNGDRIIVTVRAATNDAEVVNKAGRFLYLSRQRGGPELNYASPAFGGMFLQGNRRQVAWQEPNKSTTTCVEMP